MKDKPRMEINATPGAKVMLDKPEYGWPHDVKTLKECGAIMGQEYTVDRTEIHSAHTTLFLKEFPGIRFNTVNFCDASL